MKKSQFLLRVIAKMAVVLVVFVVGCASNTNGTSDKNRYTLRGHILEKDLVPEYIYMASGGAGGKLDSSRVENNRFVFTGSIDYPLFARLRIKDGYGGTPFFLDKGEIKIDVVINKRMTFTDTIIGSGAMVELDSLTSFYKENKDKPNFTEAFYVKVEDVIKRNPRSQVVGSLLSNLIHLRIFPSDKLFDLYSLIDTSTQTKTNIANARDGLRALNTLKVGKVIDDFTFSGVGENDIPLSGSLDKLLLIEFWASWCSPCREATPKLKEMYKMYKSEGFSVFGISIDRNRKAWLDAVKEDQIPWVNTIAETKEQRDVVDNYFFIKSVPSNILIDKDRAIVGINIEPDSLSKILSVWNE